MTYDGLYKFGYDGWNRMVKVERAYRDSGGTMQVSSQIAALAYDGVGRRIVKAITNSGDWDCTYHYYYNGQSMIEERNGSDVATRQYTWGLGYIDELCQIKYNNDPEDGTENICETARFALQDANYNVLGVTNITPRLVERYEYTPYGQRTVFTRTGNGDYACFAPVLESQPVNILSTDMPYSLCDIGHQGLLFDKEFGKHHVRTRPYDPVLARFTSPDWLNRFNVGGGYQDGPSKFGYLGNNPVMYVDPFGTDRYEACASTKQVCRDGKWKCDCQIQAWHYEWVWWSSVDINRGRVLDKTVGLSGKCDEKRKRRCNELRALLEASLYRERGVEWARNYVDNTEWLPSSMGVNTGGVAAAGLGGTIGLNFHWDFENPNNTGVYVYHGEAAGLDVGLSAVPYVAWGTQNEAWGGADSFGQVEGNVGSIQGNYFQSQNGNIQGVGGGYTMGLPGGVSVAPEVSYTPIIGGQSAPQSAPRYSEQERYWSAP